MGEPETAAGRRLLADLDVVAWFREPPYGPEILAIEADARADLLAELRAAVEGLPRADGDSHWFEVDKRDVLALLEPPR